MRTKQTRQCNTTLGLVLQHNRCFAWKTTASYVPIISHKLIIGLWPLLGPPELDYTIYISNDAIRLLVITLLIYN